MATIVTLKDKSSNTIYPETKGEAVLDLAASILDIAYPVNSLYISTNSTSPASFLGGTWTAISANYALWTATSGAGNTIAAGLPNITGQFAMNFFAGGSGADFSKSGVFNGSSVSQWQKAAGSGSAQTLNGLTAKFSATNSNSIYGNSSTVQPPAYKVYAWKRTA